MKVNQCSGLLRIVMEAHEKIHIRSNLVKLLQIMSCSPLFLAELEQDGILHNSEAECIGAIASNRHQQARTLLETVMTQKNGYAALLAALQQTSQSGALSILHVYCSIGTLVWDKGIRLGTGCHATTKVSKGSFDSRAVAVKEISCELIPKETALREVSELRETILHVNLVQYLGVKASEDGEFVYIALELCDMTLTSFVERLARNGGNQKILELDILRQATLGIEYLHSRNIIHRDIKPENILIQEPPHPGGKVQVKLSDFGLSRQLRDKESQLSFNSVNEVCSDMWAPPEVLVNYDAWINNGLKVMPMTKAMDIFSLGCVFYFVISGGHHPFGRAPFRIRIPVNIVDGKLHICSRDIKFDHFPAVLLVMSMVAAEPASRPSATDILSHPIFTSNNEILDLFSKTIAFANQNPSHSEHFALYLEGYGAVVFGSPMADFLARAAYPQHTVLAIVRKVVTVASNFAGLSQQLQFEFGQSSSDSILYWQNRFPFLASIVWWCYQVQGSNFHFNVIQIATELLETYYETNEQFRPNLSHMKLIRRDSTCVEIEID